MDLKSKIHVNYSRDTIKAREACFYFSVEMSWQRCISIDIVRAGCVSVPFGTPEHAWPGLIKYLWHWRPYRKDALSLCEQKSCFRIATWIKYTVHSVWLQALAPFLFCLFLNLLQIIGQREHTHFVRSFTMHFTLITTAMFSFYNLKMCTCSNFVEFQMEKS